MTDKERLQFILDNYSVQSIEEILQRFLSSFEDDLSIITINELHKQTGCFLTHKVKKLELLKRIAYERASHLKSYLDGTMWNDEELAKRNVQPQINNAQAIISACKYI